MAGDLDGVAWAIVPTIKLWRAGSFTGVVFWVTGVFAAAESPNPRYTGNLFVREWTPEETGGKPQSFSVIQHPATGLIYAGNEAGVLEYDGTRWRRLPLPVGAPEEGVVVRGRDFDEEGRLWAAAENDVLIYAPDARGRWQPESLRSRLPAAEPALGVVWQVRRNGGAMCGVITDGVIWVELRTWAVRRWPVTGVSAIVGLIVGQTWIHHRGKALLRVRGDSLEPAPVPTLPEGVWVHGVLRTAAGVLQVEHSGGVLELRDGASVPLAAELGVTLAGAEIASRTTRLPDGGRVFSTRSRTLVFADAAGRVLGRIAEPPGVSFGVTPQTMWDRDGGLWIANASGIRRARGCAAGCASCGSRDRTCSSRRPKVCSCARHPPGNSNFRPVVRPTSRIFCPARRVAGSWRPGSVSESGGTAQ
jgi:hypothetical protein